MGCCASSNRSLLSETKNNDFQPSRSSISHVKGLENRAPPSVEEETVKEVLSETSKWKKPNERFNFEVEKPKCFEKFDRENSKIEKPYYKIDEISEVSEVCSLSESVSTITATDRREEDEESCKRVNGSPAKMRKNRTFSGEKRDWTAGKSPVRRSEQSPAKRNGGSVRIVQKRDQMGNGGMKNQPLRRDSGENSGRRSRSPATRTDNGSTRSVVGRSLSARRMNQSPGKGRTAAPENDGRKMENSTMESKWPSTTNDESLENPLVSLECFIFL
ncbi:uncharacterized protein LOC123908493 [Trifolium pratense]|uniref:Uncharacterized protein n=1 Tax=Trifolium pratense TaxID=57577 RepID=A0ACB0JYI9_TRIPR|nr:uncharacterized protein LOC123908493 [Trifolium pratense]CAJ2648703.1 unnamed protein product [Trifolium pratense]